MVSWLEIEEFCSMLAMDWAKPKKALETTTPRGLAAPRVAAAMAMKPRPEVIRKMMDCLEQEYGNASANYQFASVPRRILQEARERIAASLSVQP